MHQSFKPKLQKGPRRELLFSVYSIVSPPPATSISKMIIFKISKSQWFFLVLLSIVLQQEQQKYFFPHWKEIIYCLSLIEKKIVLEFWRGRKNLQQFCFKEEAAKKNSRKSLFSNFLPLLQKTDFSWNFERSVGSCKMILS